MENSNITPRNPKDVNVERPKDARTGPLCTICGQPEEGHPLATPATGIHDYVGVKTDPAAEIDKGTPTTGVVPTEPVPTPPPTEPPPPDKPAS